MAKQRNPNGEGSYRKKSDGRYEWKQVVDGKERYVTARTLKELKEKVKKVSDTVVSAEKITVDEWFKKWLENAITPLKKESTSSQYEYIYRVHIKPALGEKKLQKIKRIDIQGVIAAMNKKGLATKTMKHAKNVMSLGFDAAITEKLISVNPVKIDKIDIPKKQPKKRKTLTATELHSFFKALENSRWKWSVKFDLITGLRRGELLGLQWTDIDFDNKRILVERSNTKFGLEKETKSSQIRYVPLPEKAIEILNEQKKMLNSEGLFKCELIFPSNKGELLKAQSYYSLFKRFADKAGIYAHPHCIRHTFVYLTRDSLSLKDLQFILGHSDSTQTLDIYGDIINDDNQKKIDALNNAFNELDSQIEKISSNKEPKIITLQK